jgi:hypothetical protein
MALTIYHSQNLLNLTWGKGVYMKLATMMPSEQYSLPRYARSLIIVTNASNVVNFSRGGKSK